MVFEKVTLLKEVLGEFHREGGHQYLFHCPEKGCNHWKRKLSVNFENNVFKCWICDYRGKSIGNLVKKHGTHKHLQKWINLSGEVDFSNKKKLTLEKEVQEKKETTISLPKEFCSLANENKSFLAKKALGYLKSRGITKKDILKWKIGFASSGQYENRIIIPSFNNEGYCNYFIARTYNEDWIKYLNPKIEHDIVFNELFVDWNEDIVVVEGVFDAIVAGNAIPLLTSTLREKSKLFQEIVKRDNRVFLALDPNAKNKEIGIMKNLLKYGVEVYKIDIDPYEDVGSMTKQEFQRRKENAIKVNKLTILRYKVVE